MRAGLLVLFAAMVLATGAACSDDRPGSTTVDVYENGTLLGSEVPRQQAVEDVSARVRFPVQLATRLPLGGLRLVAIEARLARAIEELGDDGRTNHVAAVIYVDGEIGSADSTALRILEYSREITPPETSEPVDVDGETVHVAPIGPGGRSFAWNDGDRGYIVELGEPVGEEAVTAEGILEMLESLR